MELFKRDHQHASATQSVDGKKVLHGFLMLRTRRAAERDTATVGESAIKTRHIVVAILALRGLSKP